jgi:hypothetical protein
MMTTPVRPGPACHPFCPGAAVGYARLLAAHGRAPARPLLTPEGIAFVRQLLLATGPGDTLAGPITSPLPYWDEDSRRLWLGGLLLRQFRQPAPHQTTLLAAFQEEGWHSGHIDDPLSLEPGEGPDDARKRLRETIHNLNQSLPAGTIRFRGDGTGEGVWWERCDLHGGPPAANGHTNTDTSNRRLTKS